MRSTILAQQEPYPAVVVDRHWNLLKSNAAAVRLVEFLVGGIAPETPINLADALVAPNVLRPHLTNWAEVVRHFIRSVEVDAASDGSFESTALLERLMATRASARRFASPRSRPTPVRCSRCTFTSGTQRCACLPPLPPWAHRRMSRYRSCASSAFFPMDDATAKLLKSWVKGSTSPAQ